MAISKFSISIRIISCLIVVQSSKMNIRDHVDIIENVYHFYKSTSVTIIHFSSHQDTSEKVVIFDITRMLSNEKIIASVKAFEEITSSKSYEKLSDSKESVRPLNVMLITSRNSTLEMEKLPKYSPLHASIILFIFMEIDGGTSNDFCKFTIGNLLGSRFDTRILVKCYEDDVIRKWYPETSNQVDYHDWAIWTPRAGLTMKWDNSSIERMSLDGRVLRIGAVKESYFSRWKNGHFTGFFNDILRELQKAMNFSIEVIKIEENYGRYHEVEKTWSGAIGLAVRGEVDLVVSDFSLSPHRVCCVDFTVPLLTLKNCLFLKRPLKKVEVRWYGYFLPFSSEVWIAIILLLLMTPILLTFIVRKLEESHMKPKFFSDNCLDVWALFCLQGLSDSPSVSPLRVAYSVISTMAFIMLSVYSASLISNLALPKTDIPFKSLEDFVKDGTYKMAIIRDSSKLDLFQTSNDSTFRAMSELLLPKKNLPTSLQHGFDRVCREKLVFYGRETLVEELNRFNVNCRIARIKTGTLATIAMIMPKNCPYKSLINHYINTMKTNGVLKRILSKYVKKLKWAEPPIHRSVGFWEIALLLSILGGGFILGTMILLLEQIFSNYMNEQEDEMDEMSIQSIDFNSGISETGMMDSAQFTGHHGLMINFLRSSYNPRIFGTHPIIPLGDSED